MEHWHPNPDFFFLPGAGPMLDIGPYYVANLINLIGPVRRVAALTNAATPDPHHPDRGPAQGPGDPGRRRRPTSTRCSSSSAAPASPLGASWDVWAHRHRNIELYGTEGALFVPDPNWFGGTVELAAAATATIAEVAPWDHPFGVPNDHRPTRRLRQLPHRRPRRHGDGDHRGARRRAARSSARCTAST